MPNLIGTVVLYHPDLSLLHNIDSYLESLDLLIAVDNSEHKQLEILEILQKNPKIRYVDNHGNQGIAHALNVGASIATEMGYRWLLTMDQDSAATEGMIAELVRYTDDNVSIVSPFHANAYFPQSLSSEPFSPVLTTMTSGNLLNLQIHQKLGGFLEELFIDYVDNEYCLRSNLHGYAVIQANRAVLHHNLGDLKRHRFLWKRFFSTNHSPIRRYYAFRNRLKIIELYQKAFPQSCNVEKSRFLVDLIVVLFYEKQKFAKFKMMVRGSLDYRRNRFGKYHD
ncbi:MAG: glycosyltransferase family 2 protein [Sulfuricurvum sp.]|jgi:rhamnosyltransferase|uniref:glycosyltransferase family 2 protein n=1 Tax=Sulfuricurvum sp. TaxID=2025608 RepID=UPI0025D02D1A|nr:glycosyltransferase family 2 protein [Sulfuricurvum sp.]MCK9374075.1 glycosyltransferase family 2 protein [Sulfuricurvum sp.]